MGTSKAQPNGRMTREEYRDVYLRSDHWRQTRLGALERAENRCQVCNRADRLDVHHRTYERVGAERPADLTVLCRGCHELFHTKGTKLAPAQHVRNWSTMPADERAAVEMRCLRALVTNGAAKTKAVAADIGERTQVVGSCFVALRRRSLVKKQPRTAVWSATTKGVETSGIKPVWPDPVPDTPRTKRKSKKLVAVEVDNQRLHREQSANKRKQQLVREGHVSASLRSDLAHRYRA